MKIAHLIPASIVFPLKQPNGRYTWVLELARLQANAGHDVTIFAGASSSDSSSIKWRSLSTAHSEKEENNVALMKLALADNSFDIYHSHFDNLHYSVGHLTDRPIVFTQHWWPYEDTTKLAKNYTRGNIWAVPPTVFMDQYDQLNGMQTKGHIYHGIDLSKFYPTEIAETDRILFVGRISPEKNLEMCIQLAKKANVGMDIVGKITAKNQLYWQEILPSIDGEHIKYLGTRTQTELTGLYSSARVVLFPADMHEAFGLVAIEAQACGTPVIMAKGGSRSELTSDGVSGFLCESEKEYLEAIDKSQDIEPRACREFAEKFDVATMASQYMKLYEILT